jgi:hypothetical protein
VDIIESKPSHAVIQKPLQCHIANAVEHKDSPSPNPRILMARDTDQSFEDNVSALERLKDTSISGLKYQPLTEGRIIQKA